MLLPLSLCCCHQARKTSRAGQAVASIRTQLVLEAFVTAQRPGPAPRSPHPAHSGRVWGVTHRDKHTHGCKERDSHIQSYSRTHGAERERDLPLPPTPLDTRDTDTRHTQARTLTQTPWALPTVVDQLHMAPPLASPRSRPLPGRPSRLQLSRAHRARLSALKPSPLPSSGVIWSQTWIPLCALQLPWAGGREGESTDGLKGSQTPQGSTLALKDG